MEEKRRKLIEWIVFAVSMVVVIGIMLFNFFAKIKREGEEYYKSQMTTIASGHAEKINTELQILQTAGETAADILGVQENPEKSDIKKVASAILENTAASLVIYHGGAGSGIAWDGDKLTELDLTECTYYRQIFKASDTKYVYVTEDGTLKENILLIVPVGSSIDKNLLIFYPMEQIQSMLRVSSEFDSDSFAVMVNIDGTIIADSDYESNYLTGANLWKNIADDYSDEIKRAKVQITNQMAGCFETESVEGNEVRTLIYAPVKVNEWAVLIGADQDFIYKRQMKYLNDRSGMLYQLLGVLLFFFAIFLTVHLVGKKKSEERDRQLREKADTDLLTGLTNKLATERKIKEYMSQYPDALAMMFVLDIDNFKKINDTMGHAFGDEVLRCLGRNIGSIFRVTDIIGRTGGDEFTIFLKFLKSDENTLKEAKKLVDFFKDFTAGEYVKYSATASIGAAVFPTHGSDFDTLYKAADKALYKAKQRGKNQLAFYDDRDRTAE